MCSLKTTHLPDGLGTEKKAVTDDYTLMLTMGSMKAEAVTTDILGRFLAGGNTPVQLTLVGAHAGFVVHIHRGIGRYISTR